MKLRFFVLVSLLLAATSARADMWLDDTPPLSWREMMACETVVVGRYESHETFNAPTNESYTQGPEPHAKVTLRVVRVLKGAAQPGQTLDVFINGLYSLQTGVVGWNVWTPQDKNPKPDPTDGVPKLCYQQQMMNPGPMAPVPIAPDARVPAIYFFPKAARPALSQRGQVQPLVWANGWKQALDGKPMDIVFRLAQNVSTPLRRDALEELYAGRDPHAFDYLFQIAEQRQDSGTLGERLWWRFDTTQVLVAMGDKRGDVYHRARGRNLFGIMACVDPERALRDITRFVDNAVQNGRGADVSTDWAIYALADFDKNPATARQALSQALNYLREPRLAKSAVVSIHELLSADNYDGMIEKWMPKPHHLSPAELEELCAWAKPRVLTALAQIKLAPESKKQLANFARSLWPPLQIDRVYAEKILLDPKQYEYDYRNNRESEADILLRGIEQLSDPQWIPLLVRVLHENVTARREHYYGLLRALKKYEKTFPDLIREEITAQKLVTDLPAGELTRYPWNELAITTDLSLTFDPVREAFHSPEGRERLHHYPPSAELMDALEKYVAQSLDSETYQLDWLIFVAPQSGKRVFEQALASRATFRSETQRDILAIAVAHGHPELKVEWIEVARAASMKAYPDEKVSAARALLRASDQPRDLAEYLRFLDATSATYHLQVNEIPFDEFWSNYAYAWLLSDLYPKHRVEYSRRVLKLLESPSLPERQTGESALKAVFKDAEFHAEDFAAQRTLELKKLRPLLSQ